MAARTSGIRRRKRGKGTVYEVRFRDGTGRERSRTFDLESEARRFRAEVKRRVDEGTYIPPSAGLVPFLTVAEDWYATTAALKRRTRITYRSAIDHNLAPLHECHVGKIRYQDVQAIVTGMMERGRKPSTVRNVLMVARLIFDEAIRQELVRENPCRRVKPPAIRQKPASFLTVAQVKALAAQLAPPYDLLVTMAAGTGMRSGELAGLRVRNLDLLHRKVHVRETVVDTGRELVFDTPKSAAGRRTVPQSPVLCRLLEDHIERRGLGMEDLVFGNGAKPMRHNTFYLYVFKPAVKAAGLPPETRFHDLRHTYASLMIAEGVYPKRLSAWMGHTTVALTMDRYGHLYDDDHQAPAGLDALYGSVPARPGIAAV